MNKMKKLLASLIGILMIFMVTMNCSAKSLTDPIPGTQEKPITVPDPTFSGNKPNQDPISHGGHTLAGLLNGIIHIPQPSEYETRLGYVMKLIQVAVNWVLGMLSFVALIYMLYCGFLVFSSGSEDKNAQKGKKGIGTAATALAGIGLSWLIISIMIRFITNIANVK